MCDTLAPSNAAVQAFVYVMPLQPHTGTNVPGQFVGRATHAPAGLNAQLPEQ